MDNENQRELDVLAALEGIHRMQESIRDTELDIVVETGIIFLRLHYQRLPPGVARRLTEISPRDVAEVSEVIRAANVYRDRLGYGPIESEVEA